jgi:hypothetical protein
MPTCVTCETKFTARVGGKPQRHCSPACRKKAHRAGADGPRATSQRPAGVGQPSNVAELPTSLPDSLLGRRVLLWVDDPLIGSGERPFVVTGADAIHVRLLSCAALVEIEVPRRVFDEHAESYDSDPSALLAILRRNVATAERHRLDYRRNAAGAVERLLAPSEIGDPWRLAA